MGQFSNPIETYALDWANGGTFSGSAYLNGNGIIGLAAVGTWTASVMTFRVSLGSVDPNNSGGTWLNVAPIGSAGTEYTIPAAALAFGSLAFIPIPPADLPSLYWVQAKSGANAVLTTGGTAQGAARSFVLFTRPV